MSEVKGCPSCAAYAATWLTDCENPIHMAQANAYIRDLETRLKDAIEAQNNALDIRQHLATLTTAHQQVENELILMTQERDIAEQALRVKGYRKQCDIMACNCGPQWNHGGHADRRLSEIAEVLPWENGKTLLQRVTDLQSQHQQAVKERDELLENLSLCKGNELAAEVDTLKAQLSESHDSIQSAAGVVADRQASLQQAVEALAGVTKAHCDMGDYAMELKGALTMCIADLCEWQAGHPQVSASPSVMTNLSTDQVIAKAKAALHGTGGQG